MANKTDKNWIIAEKKSNDIVEQILINRQIKKEDRAGFLNPNFEKGLHDPYLMKGMRQAVDRIERAISQKEVVGIFGDYDADGIPGLALLFEVLTKIGFKPIPYIPSRNEGYGLNKEGIDFFAGQKVTLMVTVDLGIRSIDQIKYAQTHNIETIILDHHEPGEHIPDCIVVNPKQKGDKYPFRELSGCGVAFKLAQGLSKKFSELNIAYLKWLMDLVAIATICDIVPLIDENRVFAKFGLIVLRKTRRLGLQKLYQAAAIDPENVDTYTVGFQIGPRLNAPGRMDHANQSFYLLISRDEKEARELASSLDQINRRRQAELDRVLAEAKEKVKKNRLLENKIILVSGENWPHGIIGLVAGKLTEEHSRPVIVCEKKGQNFRGSARSIEAFNIIDALEQAKEHLTAYGGHAKAAGLNFNEEHLKNLYDKLLEIAEEKLTSEDLKPKLKIDTLVNKENLDYNLSDKIKKLEPFGYGNPRPVLALEQAKVNDVKTVGQEGKHLKMKVEGLDAIGFDLGEWAGKFKRKQIDLAFNLDEDTWNGNKKLQLKIIDIKE